MTPQPTPTPVRLRHPALLKAVKAMTYAISRRIIDGGEPLTSDELVAILDDMLGYTELQAKLADIRRVVSS